MLVKSKCRIDVELLAGVLIIGIALLMMKLKYLNLNLYRPTFILICIDLFKDMAKVFESVY